MGNEQHDRLTVPGPLADFGAVAAAVVVGR